MNSTEEITEARKAEGVAISVGDLGVVADTRPQGGGWAIRLVYGPDDVVTRYAATEQSAKALAMRHAQRLAE